jgi:hypothetical protein
MILDQGKFSRPSKQKELRKLQEDITDSNPKIEAEALPQVDHCTGFWITIARRRFCVPEVNAMGTASLGHV